MLQIIKKIFKRKEKFNSRDTIGKFLCNLSIEESKILFIKYNNFFKITYNESIFKFNGLHPYLIDFFNTYKSIILIHDYINEEVSHKYIKEFENDFIAIGESEGMTLIVKKNKIGINYEDDSELNSESEDSRNNVNLYIFLISFIITNKYEHLTSKEEIENAIKKELDNY